MGGEEERRKALEKRGAGPSDGRTCRKPYACILLPGEAVSKYLQFNTTPLDILHIF